MVFYSNNNNYYYAVPDPQSVTVTSSLGNIILSGSNVTLTCSVQMKSSVTDSEVSLLMVEAQFIKPGGTMLSLANPVISGTTFSYSIEVKDFDDNDFGSYTCSVTVRPRPSSLYLTGTGELSGKIVIGEK